jgi:hypothetical protein
MQFKLNGFICKYNKLLIVFGLFFIALFVCMISPLNPFSGDSPETDSSIFLTGARLFLQSKIPYVDFYDHKPPLIFLIDALGLFIGGFVGVWLLELISMSVSVFFAYRIARFFAGKLASLLGTIFSFVILTFFFAESNMTEEYVLPFIFCLFLHLYKVFFL